jgi:hypothetical protein
MLRFTNCLLETLLKINPSNVVCITVKRYICVSQGDSNADQKCSRLLDDGHTKEAQRKRVKGNGIVTYSIYNSMKN